MTRIVIIILLILTLSPMAAGQEFTVMFYNVENLFDTADDTTRNDEEFLPEGSRRWTANRYNKKINALSRAISAAAEWELPALIGLCEVENEEVVKDLAFGTILSAGNYGVVHTDSPDLRGIDVALLYRHDYFRIAEVRSWVPERPDSDPFLSRNLSVCQSGDGSGHAPCDCLPLPVKERWSACHPGGQGRDGTASQG